MKSSVFVVCLLMTAAADQTLKEADGTVWTVKTGEPQTLGGGQATRTAHEVWRGAVKVETLYDGSSVQSNPSLVTTTAWVFRVTQGELECLGTTTRTAGDAVKTVTTKLKWNGKELAAVR